MRATKPLKDEGMSDIDERSPDPADSGDVAADVDDGALGGLRASMASANGAPERHVAVAVPLRAVERNRRVASSVLAGGFAYRIFLWLLPFGLVVGGALGLSNAKNTEDAVD